MGTVCKGDNGILIEGDFDSDDVHSVSINGQEYNLVAVAAPAQPTVVNKFKAGQYVQVSTPKRPGHRVDERGRVIGEAPSYKRADALVPEVYVDFPTAVGGCGNALGQAGDSHGCRMPVTGLQLVG